MRIKLLFVLTVDVESLICESELQARNCCILIFYEMFPIISLKTGFLQAQIYLALDMGHDKKLLKIEFQTLYQKSL